MLKVIHKYRQYMLVGFGVVLMIAFIVPQAGNLVGGDQMARKVATIDGSKVTLSDMNKARAEYEVVKSLLEPIGLRLNLAKELFGAENDRHWLLLSHAAQQGGYMSTAADGKQFEKEVRDGILVPQLARGAAVQKNPILRQVPKYIDQFAAEELRDPTRRKAIEEEAEKRLEAAVAYASRTTRTAPADVQLAFAKANAIGRMQSAWGSAHRVSDKRATLEAEEQGEVVYVDHALMVAKSLAPLAAAPSEETLQKLFEKYKDVKQGAGDHGFGYRLPAGVELEWMKIDRGAIAAGVKLDPVEVNKYWRQNRAKFAGEFGAERPRVEAELRDQRVDSIMGSIDKAVKAETIRLMGKVPTKNGYRVLPDDWQSKMPRLEKVAQFVAADVKELTGAEIPLPQVIVRADQFLSRNDVFGLEGLGNARVRVGTKEFGLSELVFKVKELAGTSPDASVQVGVPFDSYAEDAARNRYYFTILAARKDEPATSLSQVRSQVELDAKALEQFEKLSAQADIFRTVTITDGFEGLSKYYLEAFPGASAPVQRHKLEVRSGNVQGGDSTFNLPQYREAILKAARALDPSKAMTDYPPDQRTLAVVLDKPLTVAVVQMVGRSPVSVERMRNEGDYYAGNYSTRELPRKAVRDAYSFPALKERLKYVDLSKGTEEPAESSTAPEKPVPAEPDGFEPVDDPAGS